MKENLFVETGSLACHAVLCGEVPDFLRRQKGSEETAWAGTFTVVSSGKVGQGKQV